MAFDEGYEGGGGTSGGEGSSGSYESSSDSFESNLGDYESSDSLSFSSADAQLESFYGDINDTETDTFSSSDNQLEGVDKADSGSSFESSDSQLEQSFSSDTEELEEQSSSADTQMSEENEPGDAQMSEENESADIQMNEENESVDNQTENVEDALQVSEEQKSMNDSKVKDNGITPLLDSEENNQYLKPYNEQAYINDQLSELRGNPENVAETIGRDTLRDRIDRDTTMTADSTMRSQYVDITKAKGFLQEEMIKSALGNDFEVPDHTVKSIHEDGSVTYTDIEATAKHDVEISKGVIIPQNEKIAIESKAGNEKYLSTQIDHIGKQLEGMPEDSHRMLFVTADVNRLSAEDKERLGEVLKGNNATMNVLPFYSYDLTDTIMHMNVNVNPESAAADIEARQTFEHDAENMNETSYEGTIDEKLSFSDVVSSFFGKRDETTEINNQLSDLEKSEEQVKLDESEKNELILKEKEQFEKDTETVSKLLKDNKHLSDLSEDERNAVINVAVVRALEHDPSQTLDKAEEYRSKVQFANVEEVARENGVDINYAKRIQGYYSPDTGIKINVDAYGSKTDETLVTITHETIHMLAQRHDENNEMIPGMTGLKRSDLPNSANNTGMNEGVTEMYAACDMADLMPNRQEKSYTREVNIMKKYESIVGPDILHDAYMNSGTTTLKEDFDKHMGNGQFDDFCRAMDLMLIAENNRAHNNAEFMQMKLENMLNLYSIRKGKT